MRTIFNFCSFDLKNGLIQFPKILVDYDLLIEYLKIRNIAFDITNHIKEKDLSNYLTLGVNSSYLKIDIYKNVTVIFCQSYLLDTYLIKLDKDKISQLKLENKYSFIIMDLTFLDLLSILNKTENLKIFW